MAQQKSNFLAYCVIGVIAAGLLLWAIKSLNNKPDPRAKNDAVNTEPNESGKKKRKQNANSSDPSSKAGPNSAVLPRIVDDHGFVSSDACKKCHADAHESWHNSFHRTMTQVVTPKTVIANFDNVRLSSRGRDYYLHKKGDQFMVTMADPDWEAGFISMGGDPKDMPTPPMTTRPIVMSTGSHHMQGYWIPAATTNLLRLFPFMYHIKEQRWLPREDVFLQPDDGTREFSVWNDTCIRCHAIGGQPQIDLRRMTVDTRVAEFGIACEACHGLGKEHVDLMTLAETKELTPELRERAKMVNPAECNSKTSSEICGQCHSVNDPIDGNEFVKTGFRYRAGDDLDKSHHTIDYETAVAEGDEVGKLAFWDDGSCRVGGREYLGLIDSPCYEKGDMSCISCHSMHNSKPDDQLATGMRGNQACLQCHADMTDDIAAHTHHAAESSGSNCYNCHMPHTTYALLKAIRSHRIDSPTTHSIRDSKRPNACNLCHLDQSMQWAANKLTEWYDQPKVELEDEKVDTAASLVWALKGDAVQRTVIGWHFGWESAREASGDNWQEPFLAELLIDDYAVTRFVAFDSLRKKEAWKNFDYDFIAPKSKRSLAREMVIEQWQKKSGGQTGLDRRLLIDEQTGQLLKEEISRLLKARDKSPMSLPE